MAKKKNKAKDKSKKSTTVSELLHQDESASKVKAGLEDLVSRALSESSLFSDEELDESQSMGMSEEEDLALESDGQEEVQDEAQEEVFEEGLLVESLGGEADREEPEISEEEILAMEAQEEAPEVEVSGSELEDFESAEIEDVHFIDDDQLSSIVESLLFATDRPVSLAHIKATFKGTNIKTKHIKSTLEDLASDYASARRGFTLEEVSGGYQLRTKSDNVTFLRQGMKARPFKLSGPALEVMSIVAYKQPLTKSEIDQIRGVESGHLLRALMEKGLVAFGEKSELPGRPMYYESTRKFLEIFGLRNIKELPSLHEIDQLIPEGIGEEEEKQTLGDLTEGLSQEVGTTYSEGEDELLKITGQLENITTSTDFFEQEKLRQKLAKDKERAQDIREAIALGDEVPQRDLNWLERFEEGLKQASAEEDEVNEVLEAAGEIESESTNQGSVDEPVDSSATGEEALETVTETSLEAEDSMRAESDNDEGADVTVEASDLSLGIEIQEVSEIEESAEMSAESEGDESLELDSSEDDSTAHFQGQIQEDMIEEPESVEDDARTLAPEEPVP